MKRAFICLILLIFVFVQITMPVYAGSKRKKKKGSGGGNPLSGINSPEVLAIVLVCMTTTTTSYLVESLLEDEEREEYAAVNHEALKEEIAVGEGEFLNGLAQQFGCSDKAMDPFAGTLQIHYDSLFSNTDGSDGKQFINEVENIIKQDSTLNRECSVLES